MTITIHEKRLTDGSCVCDLLFCGPGPGDGLITMGAVGSRADAIHTAELLKAVIEHGTVETVTIAD